LSSHRINRVHARANHATGATCAARVTRLARDTCPACVTCTARDTYGAYVSRTRDTYAACAASDTRAASDACAPYTACTASAGPANLSRNNAGDPQHHAGEHNECSSVFQEGNRFHDMPHTNPAGLLYRKRTLTPGLFRAFPHKYTNTNRAVKPDKARPESIRGL
jgi:hypothetical protein